MSDSTPTTRPAPRSRTRLGRQTARTGAQTPSRSGRNRQLVPIVLLAGCLAALAAVGAGVFKVRTVEVRGANIPAAQIAAAAQVTGQNIFMVRTDDIIDRLDQLPAIEVTKVETAFPDRVIIYAQPRTPAIAWQTRDGIHLIDATGVDIGPVTRTRLPLVVGGDRPPSADMVEAIQYAVSALPRAPGGTIAGFSLDPSTGLAVNAQAGWKAVLGRGTAQTLVKRVATLVALLRALVGKQPPVYIDLRYREPYYKVAGGTVTPTPLPTP
jgi:cell division protein FtsQ